MIGANHEGGRYCVVAICDGCGVPIANRKQVGSAVYLHDADVPSRLYLACSARCRVELVQRRGWDDYLVRPLNELTGRIDRALREGRS